MFKSMLEGLAYVFVPTVSSLDKLCSVISGLGLTLATTGTFGITVLPEMANHGHSIYAICFGVLLMVLGYAVSNSFNKASTP